MISNQNRISEKIGNIYTKRFVAVIYCFFSVSVKIVDELVAIVLINP